MSMQVVFQVLGVIVPTVAVVAAWLSIRRQANESARATLEGQRLTSFADDLAATARDLKDAVSAPGACSGCGRGISPQGLIALGRDADRLADLALLHVRDEELRTRIGSVRRGAEELSRHRRSTSDACEVLVGDALSLAIRCDRAAESTLRFVHTGTVRWRPEVSIPLRDRVLGWILDHVFRTSPNAM